MIQVRGKVEGKDKKISLSVIKRGESRKKKRRRYGKRKVREEKEGKGKK